MKILYRLVPTVLLVSITMGYTPPGLKEVHCPTGRSVQDVLAKAEPGDTIRITGHCSERLLITSDRITLDGQGVAVLDGGGDDGGSFAGVIVIDSAQGVVIKGLTIQHGPNGIVAKGGAAFEVRETLLQNHTGAGIQVGAGSTVELTDSRMIHNSAGMNVLGGSSIILKGTIIANENAGNGIFAGGASLLEIRGASVSTNNNGFNGLVLDGAHAVVFGLPESQGSSLVANNNGNAGIGIPNGILEDAGSGPNTITVAHNRTFGIFLPIGGSIDCPFNATRIMVSDNPIGIYFGLGSKAIIHGGLNVRDNRIVGIFADSADTINVNAVPAPIAPNPSNMTGNGIDVDLRFGSRSIFGTALTIGIIKCDSTVLSRGTTVCP